MMTDGITPLISMMTRINCGSLAIYMGNENSDEYPIIQHMLEYRINTYDGARPTSVH